MSRNLNTTDRFVGLALKRMKTASDVHEMRKCLSIILVNERRCTLKHAATMLGVSAPTVSRLREEFQSIPAGEELPRDAWGGRRRAHLSVEEEKRFLEPFVEKSRSGELVIIASIQEAFEHRVGKEVPPSTITRFLERHRWRKLEPEPHHPDEDRTAQDTFKKKSSRAKLGRPQDIWLPPAPSE